MPRERVSSGGPFAVEVVWSRDVGYVQVATVAPEPLATLRTLLADTGLKLVDAQTGDGAGTGQEEELARLVSGWHVDLRERRDVNQLIRVLRAARDQAMGRDE